MILPLLFLNFLCVGLFSIGGGYAAVPLIQSRIVETMGWLSMEEFAQLMTIAEMTPGPIAVNSATFVGLRIGGIPGAAAATLGCITPSLLLVSLLAFVYRRSRSNSLLSGVLATLRPIVVALIASAGLSLLLQAVMRGGSFRPIEALLFLAAFAALRLKHTGPIPTMLLCGAGGLLLHMLSGGIP